MAEQLVPGANNPDSLYKQCLSAYVCKLSYDVSILDSVQQLQYLPSGVLIDVYVMMAQHQDQKHMLFEQLQNLEIFERLLRFEPARQKLFYCLATLMAWGKPLASQLQQNFTQRYEHLPAPKTLDTAYKLTATARAKVATPIKDDDSVKGAGTSAAPASTTTSSSNSVSNANAETASHIDTTTTTTITSENNSSSNISTAAAESAAAEIASSVELTDVLEQCDAEDGRLSYENIDFGMRLGSFLSEAGWQADSIKVLECVAKNLKNMSSDLETLVIRLDCLQRLLHAEAALCSFKSAERTFEAAENLLKKVAPESIPNSLLANVYTQFSALYFARSEYEQSHSWSRIAMQYLEDTTHERIAVDVLRQAAKACVVKRDFQRANMLICQATRRAKTVFGPDHQKYADTLLDYGFFLLNVDSVYQSVKVYKEALEIRCNTFGDHNFHVAIAHEELSYAYYVHEYSTGNFSCSREHVDRAVQIMRDLVPSDHLMLASAKRVKALLLEEIALDKMAEGIDDGGLLKQSEDLHKFALQLSLDVFGEVNVQTAKHYGNLGRLYQTMNRFKEAEAMHQKAIKIKSDLLGPFDYEVGLSIGHLASLYNYQMKKYREAETLYLRSIQISLRLFGRSYSGLEYDYLGLCHVYEALREFEKYLKYATILENWQMLRGQNITMNKSIYPAIMEDCTLEGVKFKFFNMCTQNMTACN